MSSTMAREGQRRPHLQERRHRRVADDRDVRRVGEDAGPLLRRHRRRHGQHVEGRRQDVGQDGRGPAAGLREGRVDVEGDAVALRRRHGVHRLRRAPPRRLRDAHLGEQRLRRDVPVAQRQPEGRGDQDADRGPAQPGRASTRERRRVSSSRSIAARTGRACRETSRTCASDEITLHPRDNAMLLATHGRAIWILDHLSPIQEYTAAQSGAVEREAVLDRSGARVESRFDDKNDEFWGHQYFVGENPPTEAVIQYFLKNTAKDVKLKIADAAGKKIRDGAASPATGSQPGIQTRVLGHPRRADRAARPRRRRRPAPWPAPGRRRRWWRRRRTRGGVAAAWSAPAARSRIRRREPVRRRCRRRRWRRRTRRWRIAAGAARAGRHLQRDAHRRRQDDSSRSR